MSDTVVKKISHGLVQPLQRARLYATMAAYSRAGLPLSRCLTGLASAFGAYEGGGSITDNLSSAAEHIIGWDGEGEAGDAAAVGALRAVLRNGMMPEEAILVKACETTDGIGRAILLEAAASLCAGPFAPSARKGGSE